MMNGAYVISNTLNPTPLLFLESFIELKTVDDQKREEIKAYML